MITKFRQYQRLSDLVRLMFFGLIAVVLHTAWGYMNILNTQRHVNMYVYNPRFLLDCFSCNNKRITSQKHSSWRNIYQHQLGLLASTRRLLSRRDLVDDDDFDFEYDLYSEETDMNSASVKGSKLPDPYNNSPIYSSVPQSNSVDETGRYASNYENIYFKTTNSNRNFLKKRNEYRQKSNLESISSKNEKKNVNKYSWTRKTDRL